MDIAQFKAQLELYLFTNKMSPFQFSKKVGIGQSSMSRIMNGEVKNNLKKSTKEKLSIYFKMPFDLIERDPSIINKDTLPAYFENTTLTKKAVHSIPIYTFSELFSDQSSEATIYVTPDISSDCFALVVEDSQLAPNICNSDTVIVNPIKAQGDDYKNLNLKHVIVRHGNNILLRKALCVDNELFLKGKNIEHYNQNDYELMGWVTEIRRKS